MNLGEKKHNVRQNLSFGFISIFVYLILVFAVQYVVNSYLVETYTEYYDTNLNDTRPELDPDEQLMLSAIYSGMLDKMKFNIDAFNPETNGYLLAKHSLDNDLFVNYTSVVFIALNLLLLGLFIVFVKLAEGKFIILDIFKKSILKFNLKDFFVSFSAIIIILIFWYIVISEGFINVYRYSFIFNQNSTLPLILLIFLFLFVIPFVEEFLFRYYFYPRLKERFSPTLARIFCSVLFSLVFLYLFPFYLSEYVFLYMAISWMLCRYKDKTDSFTGPVLLRISTDSLILFTAFIYT